VNAELEAKLASFVRQDRLPGAVAGVVCGDELTWLGGTGFAEVATGKSTDPTMIYGIASITKTFTGTAIMQLRDAGRLGLDDPAVAWLPELGSMVSPFGPVLRSRLPVARRDRDPGQRNPVPGVRQGRHPRPARMTATAFPPLAGELRARVAARNAQTALPGR